jgi:hypothetical protein
MEKVREVLSSAHPQENIYAAIARIFDAIRDEAEARGRASMKEEAAKEEGTVSDIPDEIMIAANECHLFTLGRGYRQSVEAIARALRKAEARGRASMKEEAAEVAMRSAMKDRALSGEGRSIEQVTALARAIGAQRVATAILTLKE